MTTRELIRLALAEDLPSGDVTTDSLPLNERQGRARLVAKEDFILSGVEPFTEVWSQVDPQVQIKWQFEPGRMVWTGQTLALLQGEFSSLLKGERCALNFLGRLSGIATLTRCFVQQVEHTGCRILDTRKTTPLWRQLERQAVRDGGGHNHRFSLSERVLIKDNHIRAMGSVTTAIAEIRSRVEGPLEVECSTTEEIQQAVNAQVDWILLDNLDDEALKRALGQIPPSIRTEASGNMTVERVKRVAEMGVHAISVGALTHSAPVADVSLEFDL